MNKLFNMNLLLLTLSVTQIGFAQEIKTDTHFPSTDEHVIHNTTTLKRTKSTFFNFIETEKPLIFKVKNVYFMSDQNSVKYMNIKNDRDQFILNLRSGELTYENKVIAYYCGDERHFEESTKPVVLPLLSDEEKKDPTMIDLYKSKYSIHCFEKNGFVLDKNVELDISYLANSISFSGTTEAEDPIDFNEFPQTNSSIRPLENKEIQ